MVVKLNVKTHNFSCPRRSIGVQVPATSTPKEIISSAVLKHQFFSDVVANTFHSSQIYHR